MTVEDNGCGITEESMRNLLEPFFSTKFTGRGLGLPVVLGIVKIHGGGITVESKEGKGSIFQVFLPLHRYCTTAEKPESATLPILARRE